MPILLAGGGKGGFCRQPLHPPRSYAGKLKFIFNLITAMSTPMQVQTEDEQTSQLSGFKGCPCTATYSHTGNVVYGHFLPRYCDCLIDNVTCFLGTYVIVPSKMDEFSEKL